MLRRTWNSLQEVDRERDTLSKFSVAIGLLTVILNSSYSIEILLSAEVKEDWNLLNQISDVNFDDITLTYNSIDVGVLISRARSSKAGAVASFFGTTRDTFEGKEVVSLEYEAYPQMALSCMSDICSRARKEWDLINIVLVHKLGDCPTPDVSVGIVVTSVHRKESIAAVNFAINELKNTVPIWKKEVYADGNKSWKSNKLDSAGPLDSIS